MAHGSGTGEGMAAGASRRMILVVVPWSCKWRGGVSTVVRSLSEQWQAAGLRHEVVVDDWAAGTLDTGAEEWHFRFVVMAATTPVAGIRALPGALRTMFRLWRALKSQDCVAINFHYPGINALGVALLKRLGLWRGRLVLSFHGTDVRVPRSRAECWAWQTIFAECNGITTCSGSLLNRLAQTMGAPMHISKVVYNGVDADLFAPRAASDTLRLRTKPRSEVALSIGGYIPRKGHRTLLLAFARLAQSHPDLRLVIAGQDGEERAPLTELARTLGLHERVALKYDLEPRDVVALLHEACLVVQPSLEEPFGLAVIEAAACGVPVAVSAVGGHLEIVKDGLTGHVFQPDDPEACATAVAAVLADPDEARKRADHLRAEVLRRFTWEGCAERYRALLQGESR